MNLEDLKTLNLKDIGGWPVLPKMVALLLLLVAVVFAGYWFDWKEQLDQLDATRQEEAKLRDTFLAKKKQAVNLDTYRQQLKEIDQSFGALLKQLPNKSEMDALLVDINQAGLGRGLEFEFQAGSERNHDGILCIIAGDDQGDRGVHDLGHFASDISQLPRIVTLNDIKIEAAKDGRLTMDGVVTTFRYLDEAEVSAQKKPAAGGKKGAGGAKK